MAATQMLAVIIRNPQTDELLLLKQTPPPKSGYEEEDACVPKSGYEEEDACVDSDLYDLPSATLDLLGSERRRQMVIHGAEALVEKIDLRKFDIHRGILEVWEQLGRPTYSDRPWAFYNYVEEPDFGPGPPVKTVFLMGNYFPEDDHLEGQCKWMSVQSCLNWLLDVKPGSDRIGLLAVTSGLLNDSALSMKFKVPCSLPFQEYPPGIVLVPMGSRTGKPFHATNLVIIAPAQVIDCGVNSCIANGDALIVDPGCKSEFHKELMEIVAALPRKLVVFLTHHHRDHVDGLSIIEKCNPDATLVAHENSMRRLGKGDWSLGRTSVSGGEDIYVGNHHLRIIYAPGHTDGHLALLHVSTHSLIIGDHCVGHGSAVLDITSGGNMTEYFQTTYNFLELSPHDIIPMHGRLNLWPKRMLFSYLRNRRNRESSILKVIANGSASLFDIVSAVYSDVDASVRIHAASNVRLHVEHLATQQKLPPEFSLEKFNDSCMAFDNNDGSTGLTT